MAGGTCAARPRPLTTDEVNDAFRAAAETGPLAGVLDNSTEPLVSRDTVGSAASCTFDSQPTMTAGQVVKVFGWYDNEWGYSCRPIDLVTICAAELGLA